MQVSDMKTVTRLIAAGDCDVCRLTDWWFCECDQGTDRDNTPTDIADTVEMRLRRGRAPLIPLDVVARAVDPEVSRCPTCLSENTYRSKSQMVKGQDWSCHCSECQFGPWPYRAKP